jgi:hypothetical protein
MKEAKHGYGFCNVCGKEIKLTANGLLSFHGENHLIHGLPYFEYVHCSAAKTNNFSNTRPNILKKTINPGRRANYAFPPKMTASDFKRLQQEEFENFRKKKQ